MSQQDKQWKSPCGCVVTFRGSSNYKSTKMTPCEQHTGAKQREARNRLVYQAKESLFGIRRWDAWGFMLNGDNR